MSRIAPTDHKRAPAQCPRDPTRAPPTHRRDRIPIRLLHINPLNIFFAIFLPHIIVMGFYKDECKGQPAVRWFFFITAGSLFLWAARGCTPQWGEWALRMALIPTSIGAESVAPRPPAGTSSCPRDPGRTPPTRRGDRLLILSLFCRVGKNGPRCKSRSGDGRAAPPRGACLPNRPPHHAPGGGSARCAFVLEPNPSLLCGIELWVLCCVPRGGAVSLERILLLPSSPPADWYESVA